MAIRDERPQHEMSPMICRYLLVMTTYAQVHRGQRVGEHLTASFRRSLVKQYSPGPWRLPVPPLTVLSLDIGGAHSASTVTPSDCNHTSHTLLDNCHGVFGISKFNVLGICPNNLRIRSLSTMLMKRFSPVGSGEVLGRILSTFHFKIIAISCEFVIFGSMSGSTLHKYSRYSQSKAKSVLILSQNTAISTCRGRSMKDDE